jgi:hypothetical protein
MNVEDTSLVSPLWRTAWLDEKKIFETIKLEERVADIYS